MIPLSLRAACASLAVVLFVGGIAGLVSIGSPWFLLTFVIAVALVIPAMFGGARPTAGDLPRIDEQLHRFRGATLVCFAAAAGLYAVVITKPRPIAAEMIRQLASLGVAFWVVAFVLMFFFAYYRTQRRMASDID
jgi:hypothetical protein